jgi:hypothetical protein
MTWLRSIGRWYATSWVLLLTHALCILIGAAWMYLAIEAALHAKGVL